MKNETTVKRPSYAQVLSYARVAVKSELEHPYHAGGEYDHQAVMWDVLNHFEGLTNSDEDFDLIGTAIREAATLDYPDLDL